MLHFIESCASDTDISGLIGTNLEAGARLATKNRAEALDEKTARTYEISLIALEEFASTNGNDAVLFGNEKKTFLAATIQTYMRKYSPRSFDLIDVFIVNFQLLYVLEKKHIR